jgi:hypothetical protein
MKVEAAGIEEHAGLVRQLFARRDLAAHQPGIPRELDPAASRLVPRRAGSNRGFMADGNAVSEFGGQRPNWLSLSSQ